LHRFVNRLDRGHQRAVTALTNAHTALGKIIEIVDIMPGIANNNRQCRSGGNGVELSAGFDAGEMQDIDTGGLVRAGPFNGCFKTGNLDGATARDDNKIRILAAGDSGAHLTDTFLDWDKVRLLGRAEGLR
jgi:hypothetical protein